MSVRKNFSGLVGLLVATALMIGAAAAHAQSLMLDETKSALASPHAAPAAATQAFPSITLDATAYAGEVDLTWTTSLANVARFVVERWDDSSKSWRGLATQSADDLSYNDQKVAADSNYTYRIRAFDASDRELADSHNQTFTTPHKNLVDVIRGKEKLTTDDFADFVMWQDSVKYIVVDIFDFIPRLMAAIVLLAIFWLIYRMVRRIIIGSMAKAHVDSSIRDMLGSLIKWSIMGFGLVIACNQIGLEIAALLTGVSIIGLAIGFAAQETLANFIAGVVIFWDKPFKVGDWIVIDDMFGQVRRVSFRSTRMLNLSGETIVMPNTYMLANRLANHSTHPHVRVDVPISIAYKESIDLARCALLATVVGDERINKDPPPQVVVEQCADSSVNLFLWLWIMDEAAEKSIYHEYLEKAKKALDAAHIEIPFPHMQLLLAGDGALGTLTGNSVAATPQ